jgi:hypothetical protein
VMAQARAHSVSVAVRGASALKSLLLRFLLAP